jgi:hypothetical protein
MNDEPSVTRTRSLFQLIRYLHRRPLSA